MWQKLIFIQLLFYLIIFFIIPIYGEEEKKKEEIRWTKFLEVATGSSQISSKGPETIGSLLSSMRLASSLTSNLGELYRERNKNSESTINSKIKFSYKPGDYFFYSIMVGSGSRIRYERESIGNKGTLLNDDSSSRQNLIGARIGIGPLNYLSRISYEFSLGGESINQSGPFQSSGYRSPKIQNGNIVNGDYLLGQGNFSFNMNAFTMNYGFSFSGDIFGMYGLFEVQYLYGKSSLNSISIYPNSRLSNSSSVLGDSDLQIATLKLKKIKGAIMLFEMGFIIKFSESIGVKLGGYYQSANFLFESPSGYLYENGKWNEASSSTKIVSAQTRNYLGFYGVNFGVVTRF